MDREPLRELRPFEAALDFFLFPMEAALGRGVLMVSRVWGKGLGWGMFRGLAASCSTAARFASLDSPRGCPYAAFSCPGGFVFFVDLAEFGGGLHGDTYGSSQERIERIDPQDLGLENYSEVSGDGFGYLV